MKSHELAGLGIQEERTERLPKRLMLTKFSHKQIIYILVEVMEKIHIYTTVWYNDVKHKGKKILKSFYCQYFVFLITIVYEP